MSSGGPTNNDNDRDDDDALAVLASARSRFVVPIPYYLTPLPSSTPLPAAGGRPHPNADADDDQEGNDEKTKTARANNRRREERRHQSSPPRQAAAPTAADGWFWEEANAADALHTPGAAAHARAPDDAEVNHEDDDFHDDSDFQRRDYFARETAFACHAHSVVLALRAPPPSTQQQQPPQHPEAASAKPVQPTPQQQHQQQQQQQQRVRRLAGRVAPEMVDVEAGGVDGGGGGEFQEDASVAPAARQFPIRLPVACRNGRTVELRVVGAFLVLFEFPGPVQVPKPDLLHHGFLVVDVRFPDAVDVGGDGAEQRPLTLEDVLMVNEYFRYYRCPYLFHYNGFREFLADSPLDWRQPSPPPLAKTSGPSRRKLRDSLLAAYLGRWDWMLACPIKLTDTSGGRGGRSSSVPSLWTLMPAAWISQARDHETSLASSRNRRPRSYTRPETVCGWLSYADSRAFVWSAVAGSPARMRAAGGDGESPPSGAWVRFLNVDSPGTGPPSRFESDWAAARTYMRWAPLDSRYGFTDHSGVLWTSDGAGFVVDAFFNVYFDMALLLLYTRAVLFRFSSDLFDLAELTRADPAAGGDGAAPGAVAGAAAAAAQAVLGAVGVHFSPPWHPKKVAEHGFLRAREQFSRFVDLYLFPLVSNQQQGVELYTLFRTAMDVDVLHAEIKTQVSDSHDFYSSKVGREQNNVLFMLTIVTFLSIPVSAMFGLLGASEWLSWTKRRLGYADPSDPASGSNSSGSGSDGLRAGIVDDWFLQVVGSALLWGVLSIALLVALALLGNSVVAGLVASRSRRYLGGGAASKW
ncbi:hypothetical protein DFJ73DRAFT_799397 [Zopfochytrium polystomum]|nr:hypothetical protein DFJ73DRAFT_799397 [Zopfochytrium polystomum]